MAKRVKFCTRCMNIIHKNDTKCTQCGYPVSKMQEEFDKQNPTSIMDEIKVINNSISKTREDVKKEKSKTPVVMHNDEEAVSTLQNQEAKTAVDEQADVKETVAAQQAAEGKADEVTEAASIAKEAQVTDKKAATLTAEAGEGSEAEESDAVTQEYEDIDMLNQDNMDISRVGTVTFETEPNKPKRHKHKKKVNKNDTPKYTVDKDGSYNIDTSDVTYLEGVEKPTSSIKKARGDFKQEKVEWWDIYKWADRMLAKRKIMKEVNKAARKTPEGIKRTSMILWCIFFGWLGIHNFYARNYKKGWTVVAFDVIMTPIMFIPVLYEFCGISIGGGLAFVVGAMWLLDLFGLITNRYKYRISKEEFISNLNVNTRAKLGKKYIDLDRVAFKAKEKARLEKYNKKREKKLQKKAEKAKRKLNKE